MKAGKKIKLIRLLKGFTQKELAHEIGKTRALLSHIEKTDKINHETLLLILKALKITENDFDLFDEETVNNIVIKKSEKPEDDTMKKLHEELIFIKKENILLQEIIQAQKELINVLKKKG